MRRVVVTGLGVISSIGNSCAAAVDSLRRGRSGLAVLPQMVDLGYGCQVYGPLEEVSRDGLSKRLLQSMSAVSIYSVVAAREAAADAGLMESDLQSERCAVVVGTGAGGTSEMPRAERVLQETGKTRRAGGTGPAKMMNSTASSHLAAHFGVQGRAYSLSAACSTGLYDIGHAYELVKFGLADVCLCGSAEEQTWNGIGATTDNTRGMPRDYNDRPAQACRPYDRDRQGFVLSEGAGILALETLERAQQRGAKIYAEIIGYGAANDGGDILSFQPTGVGLRYCIEEALEEAASSGPVNIDYVNPHGAGTVVGDPIEVAVLRELVGDSPLVSSTKALSGHSMGAAAAQEAVFTLLMLEHGFAAATANLENVASDCAGIRHIQHTLQEAPLKTALTVNAGLGGANAAMVFRKL